MPFTDSLIRGCWAAQWTKLQNSIPRILGETKAFTGQGSTFGRKQNSIRSSVGAGSPSGPRGWSSSLEKAGESSSIPPPPALLHKEMPIGMREKKGINSFLAKCSTFLLIPEVCSLLVLDWILMQSGLIPDYSQNEDYFNVFPEKRLFSKPQQLGKRHGDLFLSGNKTLFYRSSKLNVIPPLNNSNILLQNNSCIPWWSNSFCGERTSGNTGPCQHILGPQPSEEHLALTLRGKNKNIIFSLLYRIKNILIHKSF